jgi:hypothetical protein
LSQLCQHASEWLPKSSCERGGPPIPCQANTFRIAMPLLANNICYVSQSSCCGSAGPAFPFTIDICCALDFPR